MKKIIKIFLISVISVGIFTLQGCEGDDMYNQEMYRPVIYMLNNSGYNVYNVVFSFNEDNPTGYFSIGCGGSLPNPEEITVELEHDTVLLSEYNRLNFVLDTASFAKELPAERFQIDSYTVVFPANSPEQYVKVPVKINQQGLSPDSIYFIPLAIKSISKYELNQEKKSILFRVLIENDYAEQINTTTYYQRGQKIELKNGNIIPFNGSKIVQPLSKDEVRCFAGTEIQSNKSTLEEILKYSVVIKINLDDATTTIRSYGSIDVEQIDYSNYNRFYTMINADGKLVQYLDVAYKYRLQTAPGVYGDWYEMKETLERMM